MTTLFGVLGLILVLALALILIYNSLVHLRAMNEEGWSGIAVQLKRRHDLVGNLVESVKGAMSHENDLFTEVTALRTRASAATSVKEISEAEGLLGSALGRLNIAVENYPTLRANENVLALQTELSTLENDLHMARRYYNGTARNLNIRVESFPSCLIANAFGFKKADFFALDSEEERKAPQVHFQS